MLLCWVDFPLVSECYQAERVQTMSLELSCKTFAYSMCLIFVECLDTQLMSHGPGPRLTEHPFYGTDGPGHPSRVQSRREGFREREGLCRGHRVEGLCKGRKGAERRREQGATWRHHAPSRHRPCEGGIVHWKQEDKELSLSQGSLEKEEVQGRSVERSAVTQ